MEELKNNNKKTLIIVTILCLVITALVGYIIYDKTSSNKKEVPTSTEPSENTNFQDGEKVFDLSEREETPVTQNENTTNEQFVEK
jgi:uncharacterized protein (TIGR02588 family)